MICFSVLQFPMMGTAEEMKELSNIAAAPAYGVYISQLI
jgi:hypothetical protein